LDDFCLDLEPAVVVIAEVDMAEPSFFFEALLPCFIVLRWPTAELVCLGAGPRES
jgi:hypothetical protein